MDDKYTFTEQVRMRIGMHSSLESYINESTNLIQSYIKVGNKQFKEINIKNIRIGRLYLIKYNYNGNLIYCPILVIDIRIVKNKYITYAINLDYLSYKYKAIFFEFIYQTFSSVFDRNKDVEKVSDEAGFQLNFEYPYKILKSSNHEHCITAFDITKIKNCYEVSNNLIYRFIFLNTRNMNNESMKELYMNISEGSEKEKLVEVIEKYDELKKQYDDNNIEYFKKLKSLENFFKLYDL